MKALASVLVLLGLIGCSSGGDPERASEPSAAAPSSPSSAPADPPDPSSPPAPPVGPTGDLATTEVCDLVRQGIDAFNVGDLDGTVERFEEAVPLAEDLAREQPSDGTETLLDAVRYYAEIPVEDYVEESESSPEFLRFKEFTLVECAYAGPPDEATDPAVPA